MDDKAAAKKTLAVEQIAARKKIEDDAEAKKHTEDAAAVVAKTRAEEKAMKDVDAKKEVDGEDGSRSVTADDPVKESNERAKEEGVKDLQTPEEEKVNPLLSLPHILFFLCPTSSSFSAPHPPFSSALHPKNPPQELLRSSSPQWRPFTARHAHTSITHLHKTPP